LAQLDDAIARRSEISIRGFDVSTRSIISAAHIALAPAFKRINETGKTGDKFAVRLFRQLLVHENKVKRRRMRLYLYARFTSAVKATLCASVRHVEAARPSQMENFLTIDSRGSVGR